MNRTKPYLNKFVLQKQLEITDSHHLQNMKQIKPITSRLMDHSQTIIINHSKGQKLKEVRQMEIQRQNQSLLGRMSSVLSKEGSYSPAKLKNFRTKVNKSLNQIFRKKQQENIALQNERFQARLVNKKPTLNLEKIDRDWKHNKRVMKKMSNCQFYLTTFRPKETKESPNKSNLGNPIEIRNKLQVSKLTKIMIIDGHKLQIKIEYSDDMLKIIGKLIDSLKVSQIIEIPKKEAINFLIQDCQGKIENILAKLRYDGKNDTMYIISNYQEQINQSQSDINPEINEKNRQTMQKQLKFEVQSKTIKDSQPKEVKQIASTETVRQYTKNNDQKKEQKMIQKKEQTIQMKNQTEMPNDKQQQKLQLITPSQKHQQKQIKNQPQHKNQPISQHEKQPQQEIILQQTKNDGQTSLIQRQGIQNNNPSTESPGVL